LLVTVVTLMLAFFGGVVSDMVVGWSTGTGQSIIASLVTPEFWSLFGTVLAGPGVVSSYLPDLGLALLFGALGCFGVLRSAFASSSSPVPAADATSPAPTVGATTAPYDPAATFAPYDPAAAPLPYDPAAADAPPTRPLGSPAPRPLFGEAGEPERTP
jgi:hypothetical protein